MASVKKREETFWQSNLCANDAFCYFWNTSENGRSTCSNAKNGAKNSKIILEYYYYNLWIIGLKLHNFIHFKCFWKSPDISVFRPEPGFLKSAISNRIVRFGSGPTQPYLDTGSGRHLNSGEYTTPKKWYSLFAQFLHLSFHSRFYWFYGIKYSLIFQCLKLVCWQPANYLYLPVVCFHATIFFSLKGLYAILYNNLLYFYVF